MRIPHSINPNTLEEYSPSPETLDLLGEIERKLFSEDFQWNKDHLPSLVDLCVQCIAKHFEQFPLYEELPCEDKDHLLELISVDLPLELVVPMIEDEYYWKRRYETHFRLVLRRKPRNWKWKNLYLERHIQQIIEDAQPQYSDEENMEDILDLCSPYVGRVIVSQLQAWIPPLTMDKEDIPEIYPNDHINFVFILRKLPNVIEVDLVFGFTFLLPNCAVLNCLNLRLNPLKTEGAMGIMRAMVRCSIPEELIMSGCEFEEDTPIKVCQMIKLNEHLKKIDISNNWFGESGGECLVQAMEVNTTLEYLDVRETDITTSQQHQLRRFLLRNRFGFLGNQELENTVLENEDSEEKTLTETVYKDHEHK